MDEYPDFVPDCIASESHRSAKPSPELAATFISELLKSGWLIQGDQIHSAFSLLHFPYPDGWDTSLSDLSEIMERRLLRFQDPVESSYLEEKQKNSLILAHQQAISAIKIAMSEKPKL
ncbi:MAG: hypothetical protein ACSHX9_02230 [Luteolibacter sp.]